MSEDIENMETVPVSHAVDTRPQAQPLFYQLHLRRVFSDHA